MCQGMIAQLLSFPSAGDLLRFNIFYPLELCQEFHKCFNIVDLIIACRDPDRARTILSFKSEQPSVAAQCTIQKTLSSKVNGGAISTPGEERLEKSAAVDSSSQVPVLCGHGDPTQSSCLRRRSLRSVVSKEPSYQGLIISGQQYCRGIF